MTRPYSMRHTEHTQVSAGDSTMSDFDPENEALVSTRELDHSHELPKLPASFRRASTTGKGSSPRLDPEYTIDTSAINRAFPEFSDVESSPDDETEDDFSIEIGRGVKNSSRNRRDDSRNSMMSIENSVRSASPAIKLDYPTTSTPPKSAMRSASKRAVAGDSLRKDAQIRRASQMQKENIDPLPQPNRSKSSGRSAEPRHTLAEMHVRAKETYDGSYISDERPQNVPVNTRTTRFGNVSGQVAAAIESASRNIQPRDSQRRKHDIAPNPTFTMDTVTNGSILLPDLPNISELVSGVYEDGTPVFTRQTRPRTTRFVSPPAEDMDVSQPRGHLPLENVPIPEDEKALFVSLKLLQDKVADLELAKSEVEKKLEDAREENHLLKAEKSRRQKEQYDRLKLFGGEDGEQARGSTKLLQDKNKLEAVNLALQNRLDIADRKVQVHESALKSLAQERDSAVTQLGVAYLNTQETKRENEALKKENAELRAQVNKLTTLARQLAGNESNTYQSLPKAQIDTEHITTSTDQNEGNTQKTSGSMRSRRQSKEQAVRASNSTRDDPQSRVLDRVEKEISRMEKQRQDEELFSLNLSRPATANMESATKSTLPYRSGEVESSRKVPNTGKQRIKRVIVEEADTTGNFTEDLREETKSQTGAGQDFTLLSFIDDREIAKLRRRLEIERATRKQNQSAAVREQSAITTASGKRTASDPPRKSSLKEPKEPIVRPSSALGDATSTAKTDQGDREEGAAGRRRRHSDHSTQSQSRRRKFVPELTSAFILPDITLRYAEVATREPARLSESAQKVLDSVAGHDGRNCTVCKRLLPDGVTHNHDDDHVAIQRGTITVPKPIPVSERMPEPSFYNEEPTLRPSRPPAEALATVLKGLEDELSHLKMQLAVAQQSFSKHDASLGKRQRKSLSNKIEKLLKEIDIKADQIYALYDVLEGQKQDGHEMTEKEMEITLQSIGIDVQNAAKLANLTGATDESLRRKTVHNVEDSDDEYDEELPWEGFESTAEMTGRHTSRSGNL
ncbi:conserved hypothetical protein [Talaromyces stipitatus ATCC 10500]|uniref:Cep57 centrosome microtubule-binding domain-containing protein n=1 Tax=Talaromyces stipitatus (strain ATCC 10500 / CBS 375.48 / QM 6759 / NRRL 1006) TaxID=441959 RepID=B8ME56_TALSN|nr:uncharacterized protein TSTA_015680 [Talaromyces stipitatus ATCC 10500]EED16483.1 conserved hypothetical protein [Talaromyces stipitatus ATCC 10500]